MSVKFEGGKIPAASGSQDIQHLQDLSRHCSLSDLRFLHVDFKTLRVVPHQDGLHVRDSLVAEAALDEKRLFVALSLDLQLSSDKKFSQEDLVLQARVVIALVYELDLEIPATENALGAFALINAAQSAWPFFRQVVHDLGSKCGYPSVILPVRKIVPKGPQSEEGEAKKSPVSLQPAKKARKRRKSA